jgi:hypothetical protein
MNSRFARLHRPYLLRGAKDPKYAYSRMVCLRSARSTIELGNTIMSSSKDLIAFKIWTINHHMYVATVILVMDYCFNRSEPRAKERKEEILECFRALKRNHGGRATVPGLQKLEKLLRDASGGIENETGSYSTCWRATATGDTKDLSHLQTVLPTDASQRWSGYSPVLVHEHATLVPGDSFGNETSQQSWLGFDFSLLENTNFDADLDPSLFDELFQNLDSNNDEI